MGERGAGDDLDHFLLTRFNVRWPGYEPIGVDPDWLAHRMEVFERFCLPSVRAQSRSRFRWLVMFDDATPEPFRARVAELARWPTLVPVYVPEWSLETLRAEVAARRSAAPVLVTTRLDNDDAISRDFVERVQTNASRGAEFLNFPLGYQWSGGRLYALRHWSNSFASRVEPAPPGAEFGTVLAVEHMDIHRTGRVAQLDGPPAWLQVVHRRNLLNRVVGVRRPVRELVGRFALDPGVIPSREPVAARVAETIYGTALSAAKRSLWRLRHPGERRVIDG